MLLADPESRLHAAVAGWKHPLGYHAMITADLYDVQLASKSKSQPKPYPRPWPANATKIGGKRTTHRTPSEVRAILRPVRRPDA